MRLTPMQKASVDRRLFQFLRTVYERNPKACGPIPLDRSALKQLCEKPDPQCVEMLRYCLDALTGEISIDEREFAECKVPSAVLCLAVAANNCLQCAAPRPAAPQTPGDDPLEAYTNALLDTIPMAASLDEILVYHCLLRDVAPGSPSLTAAMPPLMNALIGKSPLTTLTALETHKNPELQPLADELLAGRQGNDKKAKKEQDRKSGWEQALELILGNKRLARGLRRQWLDFPETRRSCRNLGLILEALRRKGNYRECILEFYEAYNRLQQDKSGNGMFPLFETIEEHLRTQGDGDAALRLNRWGNQYFLKFYALVEIIIAEKGVPKDFGHLTVDMAKMIGKVLPYTTYSVRRKIEFNPVSFEKQEKCNG
jgi:hypothetical protein